MRKLVESTFVTLDGVIGAPQEWGPPYWDEEHAAYAREAAVRRRRPAARPRDLRGLRRGVAGQNRRRLLRPDQRHAEVRRLPHADRGDLERDDHQGRCRGGGRAAQAAARREHSEVRHRRARPGAAGSRARRRAPPLGLSGSRRRRPTSHRGHRDDPPAARRHDDLRERHRRARLCAEVERTAVRPDSRCSRCRQA